MTKLPPHVKAAITRLATDGDSAETLARLATIAYRAGRRSAKNDAIQALGTDRLLSPPGRVAAYAWTVVDEKVKV